MKRKRNRWRCTFCREQFAPVQDFNKPWLWLCATCELMKIEQWARILRDEMGQITQAKANGKKPNNFKAFRFALEQAEIYAK